MRTGDAPGRGRARPPGWRAAGPPGSPGAGRRRRGPALPHGTTIVAARFDGGVVMAGDRRSTAGNMIAQRDIEKVFRSDEFSCVGIAGVAGIGLELVRLFQLELEHYEKLEGRTLSLEGKANRLAAFVRGNMGAAMQGLVVVPLFAGYDEDASRGRIFSYDVAGGRYEERPYHSIGSGSVFAKGSLKKLYTEGMSDRDVVLACMQALYDAADDDSATGGPDMARQIYPVVAMITADGFRRLSDAEAGEYARAVVEERMSEPSGPVASAAPPARPGRVTRAARRPAAIPSSAVTSRGKAAVRMPFYVSPEQAMKDKADYARKGIARGRSGVVIQYDGGILFVAPNPSSALHKISEIYDRIAFAAVGRYNEFENLRKAGVRYADITGYQYDRRTSPRAAWPTGTRRCSAQIFTESPKPFEVEIVVAEVGEAPADDQIYRITFDGSVDDEHGFVAMGGQADQVARCSRSTTPRGCRWSAALGAAIAGWAAPGQRRPGRAQRQPARGGRARPGPGAPHVPPDHRSPAGEPAGRGGGRAGRRRGHRGDRGRPSPARQPAPMTG